MVSTWMTQLGQAATRIPDSAPSRPGCSSVAPHSHVVDIHRLSRLRIAVISSVISE